MNPDSPPDANSSNDRRAIVFIALFALTYLGARIGIKASEQGSGLALVLALLPVPFFALLLVGYVRAVRGMDELARRIQLEGLAFAFPVALLIAVTAGLLDVAGFHGTHNWDLPRLWPLLLLPYWFGVARAARRYQ